MQLDIERIKQLAPFALPLMIVVSGWLFLIRPAAAEARAERELDLLRQRLAQARASVAEPPPPAPADDPLAAFERQVAAHDVSSQVIQQLAALAKNAAVTNLLIETGERVAVTSPIGPQANGTGNLPDPRFTLFDSPLAYSPVSMSFDADFGRLGQFLWDLRDLATAIEIRTVELRTPRHDGAGPAVPPADGRVHVSLTLFAYARQATAVATTGVPQ
jgi:hypothetical protein